MNTPCRVKKICFVHLFYKGRGKGLDLESPSIRHPTPTPPHLGFKGYFYSIRIWTKEKAIKKQIIIQEKL